MSNLGRFLPLSQKQVDDESSVSGDWSPVIADCVDRVAVMLARLDEPMWALPAGPDGRRVRDLAADLVDRCDAAVHATVGGMLSRSLSNDAGAASADERPAPEAWGGAAVLADQLDQAASGLRTTGRRRRVLRPGVSLLTRVLLAGYDISEATGAPVVFPPLATGAVALARTTAAPTPIRAVTRGRTLVATDDGWSFGAGRELAGTARELLLFLFDRSDRVPGG